ncbi:TetR/AcrR family transcriptional regulator [Micromonospora sp. NPDC050397]|uniref:TetR/AcrR family transcriptional regulator n=1 Tax=Micromonospora sp. NPDC050397 TaxID=3364279 RepID=UPI00384C531E
MVEAVERARRLGSEREQAILRATYELLAETGFEGLRMDAVAARAHASKATLYRHWPTKAELVTDAVRACKAADGPLPDTGTLHGDLVAWFWDITRIIISEEGPLLAGVATALQHDSEFAVQMRQMRESRVPLAEIICERALARGELTPGYDARLIDEIVPALVFMRRFALGEPVDEAFIDHLVDDIILPLLTREPRP